MSGSVCLVFFKVRLGYDGCAIRGEVYYTSISALDYPKTAHRTYPHKRLEELLSDFSLIILYTKKHG